MRSRSPAPQSTARGHASPIAGSPESAALVRSHRTGCPPRTETALPHDGALPVASSLAPIGAHRPTNTCGQPVASACGARYSCDLDTESCEDEHVAAPLLYAGTVALSSALLFVVQPMMAKSLLPRFGGSASVWITCMLFFQVVLLWDISTPSASRDISDPRHRR